MARYLAEWYENGEPFAAYRDYPIQGSKTQFNHWTGEVTGIQPIIWTHQASRLSWDQGRVNFPRSGYSRSWIGGVDLAKFHEICLLAESGVPLDQIFATYGE